MVTTLIDLKPKDDSQDDCYRPNAISFAWLVESLGFEGGYHTLIRVANQTYLVD